MTDIEMIRLSNLTKRFLRVADEYAKLEDKYDEDSDDKNPEMKSYCQGMRTGYYNAAKSIYDMFPYLASEEENGKD
jgi:hypothetical protein